MARFLQQPINAVQRSRQMTGSPLPTETTAETAAAQESSPRHFAPRDTKVQTVANRQPDARRSATEAKSADWKASDDIPADAPFQIIDQAGAINVQMRRSRLLKTKFDVFRTAIVDPSVCDIVQYTPRELAIIGKRTGATHVTFWFQGADQDPTTYLIKVTPDHDAREKLQQQYTRLQTILQNLFPNSKVRLTAVADKLVVRGQARDSEEAMQIMSIVRRSAGQGNGQGTVNTGQAANPLTPEEAGSGNQTQIQIINMLRVPGVHQVALRVKIAELSRTAARGAGIDLDAKIEINGNEGAVLLKSMLNSSGGSNPALLGQLDNSKIEIGLRWLQQQGIIRVLSEPTLVTLSGRPATFVAGGEFAVPTVVGTGGLSAVTTDFRAFGAIISFLPTVVDKDRIRLQVSPEFSQINDQLTVGGTPGLRVRAVNTTVEMREGQTLAIAGLLDESLTANRNTNVPLLKNLIGSRDTARNETELIILVTPELVHPMEPEETPPLPGFDVTEPTDHEFFWRSRIEGNPTREHRSTVWPRLRRRYGSGGKSMISGPFGHGQ